MDQVVAIGVFNEVVYAADDDIGESKLLRGESFFKTTLHHAAAMLVGADLIAVGHACFENELGVVCEGFSTWRVKLLGGLRRLKGQEESLDYMISIWVGRKVKNVLGHLGS